MFTIYLRRNSINGKCYVGQTSDFRQREYDWKCLKYRYANKHINNDRAEFGLENFTVEVLAECETRQEAWELEQYYIKQYNSIYPNGYNLSTGGAGSSGVQVSYETKLKISEALKGIQLSDETKQKMSENNARFWLGRHHSDETKAKISEAMKGIIPKCTPPKQVYQYTKDKVLVTIWPSTMECGRNGYSQSAVSQCCNNCYLREGNNIFKDYIWSYEKL